MLTSWLPCCNSQKYVIPLTKFILNILLWEFTAFSTFTAVPLLLAYAVTAKLLDGSALSGVSCIMSVFLNTGTRDLEDSITTLPMTLDLGAPLIAN